MSASNVFKKSGLDQDIASLRVVRNTAPHDSGLTKGLDGGNQSCNRVCRNMSYSAQIEV